MAELRRISGEMEPHRRPIGRRVLLPSEIEICELIGLSHEEYFYFVDLADSYNGKRSKEYDLIPDVRNDPVTAAVVSITVGIALQAVSTLLAPKPRSQEQKERLGPLRTADITGRNRFAPQANFSSVQELATLGTVIPLIFTRKGVRVNSQLLWSQFRSKGLTQQLNAIFLFSGGELETRPDYSSFAIGDSQLESYVGEKLQLIFNKNGGRIRQGTASEYSQGTLQPKAANSDVFQVAWDPQGGKFLPIFSQARFPSTSSQFGTYSPLPNGMIYRVNYELVLVPDGFGAEVKTRARLKRSKINASFPRRCAVSAVGNANVTYRVGDNNEKNDTVNENKDAAAGNADGQFGEFGVEDVVSSVETVRIDADANIELGEIYLAGDKLAVCIEINGSDEPWRPGISKTYKFRWLDGRGDINSTGTKKLNKPSEQNIIQRVALATYTTSRPCNAIEIGIKSRVFKRLNGFTNVNSNPKEDIRKAYEDKDTGGGGLSLGSVSKYINRYSFFIIQRKPLGRGKFEDLIPGEFFCVKGNTPQDVYNSITIYHSKSNNWEYRLVPYPGNKIIAEIVGKFGPAAQVNFLTEGKRTVREVPGQGGNVKFKFTGFRGRISAEDSRNREFLLKNAGQGNVDEFLLDNDAVADYVAYDQEELSNFNGPEHEISFVNEYTLNDETPNYENLAIAGIRIGASLEWSNFDQFSAYFKTGVKTKRLLNSNTEAVNLLPEIAYALLTDDNFGAGSLIGADQVDELRMKRAARFCESAGFFWDGVISEKQNLREFIFENAGYCLLDFTIIGGRFSLFPSVPIDNQNPVLNLNAEPEIKALFTDGNIRNLQVSFLSPEERQLFKAVVLWRQNNENGFPQTRTLELRLRSGTNADPEEVFDLSGFCTSENHARSFAKFALKTRQVVDHGVKFETTPDSALGLNPGDYFRLVSEATHTSRFENGSISANGTIQAKDLAAGNYQIFFYKPGSNGLQEATLRVNSEGNTTQGTLFGSIFTIKNTTTTNRVYKAESISYSDEGLVEVSGSNVPLTSNGKLEVLNWADSQFIEETY